jgi:hypothetical protein
MQNAICEHRHGNASLLREDAESYLLDYGMHFQESIFVRASGSFFVHIIRFTTAPLDIEADVLVARTRSS